VEEPVSDAAARQINAHPQAESSEETIAVENSSGKEPAVENRAKGTFPWGLSLLAVIPVTVPIAVLLVLLCKYRVKSEYSIFENAIPPGWSYILVHFADTRLVLLASFLNNITGPVAGCIMSLYAPKVAQTLREAETDQDADRSGLSPYLMTLLGGICQVSVLQQFRLFCYRISRGGERTRAKVGPALVQTARMVLLLNGLRSTFFAVIILLHFTISTIPFDQIHTIGQTSFAPGFGLSQACLEGNTFLDYFPCSYDATNSNFVAQLRERYMLEHQASNVANIQLVDDSDIAPQPLAILTPTTTVVPGNIDFRANSIGVSTECSFITSICNLRYMAKFPNMNTYKTVFNCSDSFYGVLGQIPRLADGETTAGDPDVSELCFKPSARLQ
jgi:hypothetical protein